jgi:hypothetical protein
MSFECNFCHSSFTTKSNLNIHQKRTKKCLALQNKDLENDFTCKKCTKVFTSNYGLKEHGKKCDVQITDEYKILEFQYEMLKSTTTITISSLKQQMKEKEKQIKDLEFLKDKEIANLKEQIIQLQSKLGDIAEIGAKKTTNNYRVNNNIINQLAPYDLNQEKIYAIVDEKFTENHLYAKENGIANFAVNNLLQDDGQMKMTCTDMARKLFLYKDKNGNIFKDMNATGFLENYIPAVKRKSYEIISDKDGDEVIELTECITTIIPSSVATHLANKLAPKPKE